MGLCECVHAGVFVSVCMQMCLGVCANVAYMCVYGGHGMGIPCHSLLHLTANYVHKMD